MEGGGRIPGSGFVPCPQCLQGGGSELGVLAVGTGLSLRPHLKHPRAALRSKPFPHQRAVSPVLGGLPHRSPAIVLASSGLPPGLSHRTVSSFPCDLVKLNH